MRIPVSVLLLSLLVVDVAAASEPLTKVFINGAATPVHFNDGDSLKPQTGPYQGSQSRLSGFNTLESFGPVHSWGTWTEKEMWVLAKLATKNAQHGVWHCETDGKRDTYGRVLMFCKDLAQSHIEQGLALALSIDDRPADPDLLAAQQQAIKNRRGMWAHGVPDFVVSSLHATSEGGAADGKTSNRLVSTKDGHSEKWLHDDDYAECKKVCREKHVLDKAGLDKASAALLAVDGSLSPADIARAVDEFVAWGSVTSFTNDGLLTDALKKLGPLTTTKAPDSCHVYVDYRRRFGGDRAVCLR